MKTALRLFSVVLAILTFPLLAAAQLETIDTTARGTGRQLGHTVSIKLIINRYSTPEDKQTLVNAFKQGQQQGLVNALQRMQSAGRIQIPGTVGFDLAYVEVVPTPTGRRVRFITNRRIAFAEAAWNTRSRAFDLTAGEVNINDQDARQSSGTLLPAAQITINRDGDVQFNLFQNQWNLTNIIDWKPKG
jgi:hypothetical protein